MNIAIIGSGISGLTCAHYLQHQHQITLFEANNYVGGHSATIDIANSNGRYAIDTGFIVFNDRTYNNFQRLLKEIGVKAKPTQMSFSVRNEQNQLEYNGHNLTTLFAQKRNLLNWQFYQFIAEILRFNKKARQQQTLNPNSSLTLGEFLTENKFTPYFCQNYILPMGAAIWSSSLADMRDFPFIFFVNFFANHGLLNVTNRPQWYCIQGGSREYVKKLIAPFSSRIRLNSPVSEVRRFSKGVELLVNGKKEQFDQVIFACHSDQALKILRMPTACEQKILSQMKYQSNEVILHTDTSLLPSKKQAWASWNYHLAKSPHIELFPPTLTYNMNILQGLNSPDTFCVTLNQSERIDSKKILQQFRYAHPVINLASLEAQKNRHLISGVNRSWFCGAYWYNGFHEDGVKSALDVVEQIKNKQKAVTKHEVLHES